ncbi:Predicted arabinose efflux permease, MFS family [Roseateles sp. YR242]|uniref:MFS transporter n=1 Tax=Roseateles sp. YR242 TaxID=1855305 RepID=UPI0008B720BD|nr:MFS transporter [Roseateles sp. YR242]SEL91124.1 Predicted arabinose efflux permease, MFS family [Roseateles sp. YR242]
MSSSFSPAPGAQDPQPSSRRTLVHALVALGFLVMFCSTSIKSLYQVYFSELAQHFGGSRSQFAWSGSLFMLVTGLASPVVGWLSDRRGPLWTVAAGCLAGAVALAGASVFHGHLPVFMLAYGLLGAFALAAMTYVPMGVLVDRLFDQRKTGLAYAVITNGTSISFIVLSPLWLWAAPQMAWESMFLLVGGVVLLPLALLAALGARRAASLQPAPATDPGAGAAHRSSAWSAVRRDPGFVALGLGFFGCGATMAFIDVHLVAFWQDLSAPRVLMGGSLSLLGVLELISGLLTGWLATRVSKRGLLGAFYLMRAGAVLLLLSGVLQWQTLGFAALFGATYLGSVVLTSMLCLERYGRAVKGQAFGWLFLAHQAGAFASVQLAAQCRDLTGGYGVFIAGLAAVTALGGVANWLLLAPRPAPDLAGGVDDGEAGDAGVGAAPAGVSPNAVTS